MARSYKTKQQLLRRSLEAAPSDGLVCEFGVYRGATINYLASLAPGRTFHGFDSFAGLPEDWRAGMEKGVFGCEQLPKVAPYVQLHKGLFDETLPGFLDRNTEPAALLHIDCDLYSSTKTVLELLADRIVPGTVIQFDEFFNFPGLQQHECRAFAEFCAQRGIEVEYLGYVAQDEQLTVRVTSVAAHSGSK